jgi:hypothetical protein
MPSVQPSWCADLPLQQQSVLMLAARGPDGMAKDDPAKEVIRAYRGTVLIAAKYALPLTIDDSGDTFMSLQRFGSDFHWPHDVAAFLGRIDIMPHHYIMHLMHGVEILGYKHPDEWCRHRWNWFYELLCADMHVPTESEDVMDVRLGDWGRVHWPASVR